MVTTIRILDHVSSASSYAEGETIYRLLKAKIQAGELVALSFAGVPSVPSAFINSALVRLLETFPFEVVKTQLSFIDSTKHINELIRSRFEFASKAPKSD